MIRNKQTVSRKTWGAECDAWELLASPKLSVKQECMPPGVQEIRHYHEKAEQFFFVLSGELTIETTEGDHVLQTHDGLHIKPGQVHQAINAGQQAVEFLVTSSPTTEGDRIEER